MELRTKSRFPTVRALIEEDEASPLDPESFDAELWLLLVRRIHDLVDLGGYPLEVRVYFASRLLEADVDNGGFAQAAFNIPEWFGPAADGYEALGKPVMAALIREAAAVLVDERANHDAK